MRISHEDCKADNRKMKRFIFERIPEDGIRIVLADGPEGGPAWPDLTPTWDEGSDHDLLLDTNEPEWVGLGEVYDHFRLKEITWREWRSIFLHPLPRTPWSKQDRRSRQPVEQGERNLLRLRQCITLSGHSETTLRRAIRDGRLKAHTIGRGRKRPTYGIVRGDLAAYIEASRVELPDPPRVPTIGVRAKSRHFD
jgi:hypothetical protein